MINRYHVRDVYIFRLRMYYEGEFRCFPEAFTVILKKPKHFGFLVQYSNSIIEPLYFLKVTQWVVVWVDHEEVSVYAGTL